MAFLTTQTRRHADTITNSRLDSKHLLPFLSPFLRYGAVLHNDHQPRENQSRCSLYCLAVLFPFIYFDQFCSLSYRNRMHSLIEFDRDLEGNRSLHAVNPLAPSREGDGGRAIHHHHLPPPSIIKPPCTGSSFSLPPKVV